MNNQEKYKMQMLSNIAQLGKALSNNNRLLILHLLIQAPKTVEAIAAETGMSIANTSRHLQVLKKNHLVKSIKNKNYVVYSLSNYKISTLINDLINISEDEIASFKNAENSADAEDNVKTITLTEAKKIASQSFILDARPEDEYKHGHIKNAINIPYTKIDHKLQSLPQGKPIIVYCRGRLCGITNQVTKKLNSKGLEAYSLNRSSLDWKNE